MDTPNSDVQNTITFLWAICFPCIHCGQTPQFARADADNMPEHQKTRCFVGKTHMSMIMVFMLQGTA